MTEITAASIKELREMTGAGMMDCKKALTETKGNLQEAIDWLRKKGLSNAAKKSGRVAAEGLVAVTSNGTTGAIIELNSETDFVSRNDQFQALAKNIVNVALTSGDNVETLKAAKEAVSGHTVVDAVAQLVGTIGENMNLRRSARLSVKHGVVSTYVHGAVAPGLGKIGVLVALESEGDKAALEATGKQLAMHIAASNPQFMAASDVSEAHLASERDANKEIGEKFLARFKEFEAGIQNHAGELTKERAFSEKVLEAKLTELTQTLPNVYELLADYERQSKSSDGKDKQNAQKTRKLLDVFFQEAAYLVKRVRGYGDDAAIQAKFQELKIARFIEESVLHEQVFVIDGKSRIAQVVEQAAKSLGKPVKIAGFVRFQLGEGVEKQETDFAAEVAAAANG